MVAKESQGQRFQVGINDDSNKTKSNDTVDSDIGLK